MSAGAIAARRTLGALGGRQAALLWVLLAIVALAAWRVPGFASAANAALIALEVGHMSWLVIGMTLVILSAGIDLSVGSAVALAAIGFGMAFERTGSLAAAMLAALATGLVGGAINGVLVAVGRIPALIATLGSMAVFRGVALTLGGASSYGGYPEGFTRLGADTLAGLPIVAWLALAGALGTTVLLARTRWGRELYALGANSPAARLSGVPVRAWRFWLYTVAGGAAGLTAILFAARFGSVRADVGQNYELEAITAVVLGGTRITGGSGTIAGGILGLLSLAVIRNALDLSFVPQERQTLAVAVLLLVAVWSDLRRRGETE